MENVRTYVRKKGEGSQKLRRGRKEGRKEIGL